MIVSHQKSEVRRDIFRARGTEISRVETLSDAVFGFSVSLLVFSLEVPQTFGELSVILKQALAFFATVAILFMLWYRQYIFFRHYGVADFKIILLNLAYLVIIIFYIYPLKFLFSLMLSWFTGINLFPKAIGKTVITAQQFPGLVILYGLGYFLIWFLLLAMHQHALNFSAQLNLSHYEILYTKKERRGALMNALVGLVSALIALTGVEWLSGVCYLFIPLLIVLNALIFQRQLRRGRMSRHTSI